MSSEVGAETACKRLFTQAGIVSCEVYFNYLKYSQGIPGWSVHNTNHDAISMFLQSVFCLQHERDERWSPSCS